MSVTVEFNGKTFAEWLDANIAEKEMQIVQALDKAGLDCLTEARRHGKYTDRTGNLRSSTGYAVVLNGQVVHKSDFAPISVPAGKVIIGKETVTVGGDGSKGSQTGKELLDTLCTEETGTALIFVAGMNYAKYVEAKSLNVLESAGRLAKEKIKESLDTVFKD